MDSNKGISKGARKKLKEEAKKVAAVADHKQLEGSRTPPGAPAPGGAPAASGGPHDDVAPDGADTGMVDTEVGEVAAPCEAGDEMGDAWDEESFKRGLMVELRHEMASTIEESVMRVVTKSVASVALKTDGVAAEVRSMQRSTAELERRVDIGFQAQSVAMEDLRKQLTSLAVTMRSGALGAPAASSSSGVAARVRMPPHAQVGSALRGSGGRFGRRPPTRPTARGREGMRMRRLCLLRAGRLRAQRALRGCNA